MPNRPVGTYYKQYAGKAEKILRAVKDNLAYVREMMDENGNLPYCHLKYHIERMNIRAEGRIVYSMVDDDA